MNNQMQRMAVPNPTRREYSDTKSYDAMGVFGVLWRGKGILALCMCVSTTIGAYYAYKVADPLYDASATVMMNTRQQSVVNLPTVLGELKGSDIEVNSEVEVLRGRSLIGSVVDAENLISDPEFNSRLLPASFTSQIFSRLKAALGLSGSPLKDVDVDEANRRVRNSVISSLLNQLEVRIVPNTVVFQLKVSSSSGAKSARIADSWARLYLKDQVNAKLIATEQASDWLSSRLIGLQGRLEESERKVKEFSVNTTLVSQEGLAALERQLKDTRERISQAAASKESYVLRMSKMLGDGSREDKAENSDDGQLQALLPQANRSVQAAREFDSRASLIIDRLKLSISQLEGQISTLRAAEAVQQRQFESQSQDLFSLQQLRREADADRLLYENFLTTFNETSAQEGLQQADSRILSNSVTPGSPSEPRKALIIQMAGLFGLILGSAIVLVREMKSSTFRTAPELEDLTGISVLGQVPSLPVRGRKDAIGYLAAKPTSAAAEAIRNLRTSILLLRPNNSPQVIMMTSSLPGEGKTTMALALAQNYVGLGKRVLLVEGDVRRRVFGQYMENNESKGLLAVLSGRASLFEVISHDKVTGADVLFGDQSNDNAADALSSERFSELLTELRSQYDVIVIDTPPVLLVPDARIIAAHCDSVLFTVRWDSTTKHQLQDAIKLLQVSGLSVDGLVLNQISERGMKSYGYGGAYGAYGAYGKNYYNG